MTNTTRQHGSPVVGYGLIGAGRFGQFACQQHRSLESVRLLGVADVNHEAAARAASVLNVEAMPSVRAMLAREDVELVYIAAPPLTHHDLVVQSIEAGKHVLCEKPLAMSLQDAREMIDLARKHERVLAVNLIMRYNPLCHALKQITDERLLGEPLHGLFENYAKDEPLPPEHWFWDASRSGGIFIEHGVHFFDLFQWWLGEGVVVAAQQVQRPGAQLIEQVHCTVKYASDVLVNFYHGFTQASRMDRQEMRLVFERGEVRLLEWVPTSMEIDCIADDATRDQLMKHLPSAKLGTLETYTGEDRQVTSRHKHYEVDGHYRITSDAGMSKTDLYGFVLRELLADQVAAIADPTHHRRVETANGYGSLQAAVQAQTLAGGAAEE